MKSANHWITAGLLLVGLILLNVIASLVPLRMDWTEDNLYSLSKGSRDLVKKVEEPITLTFYFTRGLEDAPISFKNFATRIEELLQQYVRASNGMIRLQVIDPEPDTEEEDRAIREGISGQNLAGGERLFIGLTATQADQQEVIPVFDPRREEMVEYDISQLIYRVQQLELPTIGVITGLPLFGSAPPMGMPPQMAGNASRPWMFLETWRESYDVVPVEGDTIPEDIDLLAVIHPQDLSESMLFAIDQFVLSGKPTLIAIDPSSAQTRLEGRSASPFGGPQGMGPTSSDLPRLFNSWGIRYDASVVAADPQNASVVRSGNRTSRHPAWVTVESINSESPVTSQLKTILLPEPGSFTVEESESIELIPLLQLSDASGTLMANSLMFAEPGSLFNQITPDESERTVAGIIRGTFPTAFPDGKPEPEEATEDGENDTETAEKEEEAPAGELLKESPETSTVFLLADTDFMADQFSVRVLNFFGMRGIEPLNDNLNFLNNSVDLLAGSSDIIAIRGQGTINRPFTKVEELEIEAEAAFQERLEDLQARLRDVQAEIRSLTERQQNQGQLVMTQEMKDNIQRFREKEVEIRSELREIRKQLREDIERLDLVLAAANMLIIPLGVGGAGIAYFIRRNQRQRH